MKKIKRLSTFHGKYHSHFIRKFYFRILHRGHIKYWSNQPTAVKTDQTTYQWGLTETINLICLVKSWKTELGPQKRGVEEKGRTLISERSHRNQTILEVALKNSMIFWSRGRASNNGRLFAFQGNKRITTKKK